MFIQRVLNYALLHHNIQDLPDEYNIHHPLPILDDVVLESFIPVYLNLHSILYIQIR